jgi:hypothetical protein
LKSDPSLVSPDVTLYVISNINPDGYAAGTEPVESQVNANGIDLNSNWDYNWQEWITYGTEPVRAGRGGSFSEPETVALHDFIVDNGIELVLFYHSGHGVIVSGAEREQCATYELAEMLSSILEYPHDTEGTSGEIRSGLAIDYLSKVAVAAAEVDLPSTEPVDDEEFQRHLEALVAFMNWTIPTDLEGSADEATTGAYEWAGEAITHTVKAGETLWGIATDYDIAINSERYEELLRVNDIVDENALQIGMVLTIPPAEPEAEPEE